MKVLKKNKIYVGLSGGVDSAVAAALLKKEGYDVIGVFLREYDISLAASLKDALECTQEADRQSALAVAGSLDIPFEMWDFRSAYHRHVVEYLFSEYKRGRTPNPDVMCNKHIKFGLFLDKALKKGADFIATGHYVRIASTLKQVARDCRVATYTLKQAKDKNKDQSYFLYTLTQKQLSRCLFPLGNLSKPEVRTLARKMKLPNWGRKDSQGICFIGKIAMKDFLKTRIPAKGGKLLTASGEVIGTHDGAAYFTIGQRHGLGYGGGGSSLYVVSTDVKKNIVVVAPEKDPLLYRKELECSSVHWISGIPPSFPLRVRARIRYRQPLQNCTVEKKKTKVKNGTRYLLRVTFDKPQRAVTPGQAIVFYSRSEMIGGGIIL